MGISIAERAGPGSLAAQSRNGAVRGVIAALVFVVSSAIGAGASAAQRYYIAVKEPQVFNQVHAQFMVQPSLRLSQLRIPGAGLQLMGASNATVEHSLATQDALIVSGASDVEMKMLARANWVDFVEAEIIRPVPKPMIGYQPTGLADVFLSTAIADSGSDLETNVMATNRLPWGITTVKAPKAWKDANYGAGARVLVLDTGVDANHPALRDNFEKGKDFSENAGSNVEDLVGHGTHVAGTVLGQIMSDGFAGVAPRAKLLAGRVCMPDGCSNLAVATGINWGIEEKVDVISMSLGGPLGSMAEKRASEAADAAGITVVAASGNDGVSRISYPAGFPTVIAVGAIDNKLQRAQFSQYGPELDVMAPGVSVNSAVPVGSGRESVVKISVGSSKEREVTSSTFVGTVEVRQGLRGELVHVGLGKTEEFASVSVKGKIALIARGEIPFGDKAKNAVAAGALGVVIYNNAPGLLQGSVTTDGSVLPIPVMMVEQVVGLELVKALSNQQSASAFLQTLATDYSNFDGTSMATPHVAGVVALVKASNKGLTPAAVRTLLDQTSTALGPRLEYGAGVVDAEKAVSKALGN